MVKGLQFLQEEIHNRLLRLRRLDFLISSRVFALIFESSNDDSRKEVIDLIREEDVEKLKKWMRNSSTLDLGELKFGTLRDLARKLHVPYYSKLRKHELIKEVERARNVEK